MVSQNFSTLSSSKRPQPNLCQLLKTANVEAFISRITVFTVSSCSSFRRCSKKIYICLDYYVANSIITALLGNVRVVSSHWRVIFGNKVFLFKTAGARTTQHQSQLSDVRVSGFQNVRLNEVVEVSVVVVEKQLVANSECFHFYWKPLASAFCRYSFEFATSQARQHPDKLCSTAFIRALI